MAVVDGDAQTKDAVVESVGNSLAEVFSLRDESLKLLNLVTTGQQLG